MWLYLYWMHWWWIALKTLKLYYICYVFRETRNYGLPVNITALLLTFYCSVPAMDALRKKTNVVYQLANLFEDL